jgi:hypothetical protein
MLKNIIGQHKNHSFNNFEKSYKYIKNMDILSLDLKIRRTFGNYKKCSLPYCAKTVNIAISLKQIEFNHIYVHLTNITNILCALTL